MSAKRDFMKLLFMEAKFCPFCGEPIKNFLDLRSVKPGLHDEMCRNCGYVHYGVPDKTYRKCERLSLS